MPRLSMCAKNKIPQCVGPKKDFPKTYHVRGVGPARVMQRQFHIAVHLVLKKWSRRDISGQN